MKKTKRISPLIYTFITLVAVPGFCGPWTAWTESPSDPIYNPIPMTDGEDYFPYVVYGDGKFDGNGDAFFYKMWHQGSNPSGSIALSYSNDGVNWTLKGETNLSPAYHPVVLYDKNRFGGGSYPYKMWFWTGTVGLTPDVIQYAFSTDGITWTTPQPITQDAMSPIVTGVSPGYFYHLYGPGFVMYNPSATSVAGQPYTFPYVMFFDTSSEGFGPGSSVEQIGLAYSSDGIAWTRFGTDPILIPSGNGTDWDATHFYRPSIVVSGGVYHLYYSGSNQAIDPLTTVVYAHGIGHAASLDGITWLKDSSPIFIYSDGISWRNSRTYTPFVLLDPFCNSNTPSATAKMWFTGGTGTTTGENQGIGYATLPCPNGCTVCPICPDCDNDDCDGGKADRGGDFGIGLVPLVPPLLPISPSPAVDSIGIDANSAKPSLPTVNSPSSAEVETTPVNDTSDQEKNSVSAQTGSEPKEYGGACSTIAGANQNSNSLSLILFVFMIGLKVFRSRRTEED